MISNKRRQNLPNRLQNRYHKYQNRLEILELAGIDLYNEYNGYSNIFDLDKDDLKIIKIIDQLIKPFNELEKMLVGVDKKTKASILIKSFELSLESSNPVESMNEMVELIRSVNEIKKIARHKLMMGDATRDPITAIKKKIKNSYIFERQNN